MKTLPPSFDQYRREIRRNLFLKRQQDKDNSEARLFYDAKKLDALLLDAGYELLYSGEWSRHFDENRHLKRPRRLRAQRGPARAPERARPPDDRPRH